MSKEYFKPIPGKFKNLGAADTDLKTLLGYSGSALNTEGKNDGRSQIQVSTVMIDGEEYSLSDIVKSFVDRVEEVEAYDVLTTRGDILYRNATKPTRLAKGTDGQFLKQGANEPEWGKEAEASTSATGLAPIVTAPAAGLRNVVGVDNTETAYTNKALFDATAPTTQAYSDAAVVGTAMTAARRDHKHAMPAIPTAASITIADAGSYFTADTAEAALQQLAAILLGFKGTATATPTSGTYAVNDKYFNSEPAPEEFIGWVCTALGTAGTLNGSATTGDILTGTAALTPSDLTGLAVGQYLDIATVTGPLRVVSLPAALGSTTVDVESAAAQKVLSVTATENFVAGETVCIGFAANCEIGVIASVETDVSLTLVDNLTLTHAIAETVTNCVVLDSNADATANDQAVSFHAATFKGFGAIEA